MNVLRCLKYIPGVKSLLLPIYGRYARHRRNLLFRRNGINVLHQFDEIMLSHKIHYTVYAGTLLGAVREGGLLKHDMDLDTMMFYDNYNESIKNVLAIHGFKLLHTFLADDGRVGREDTYIKDGVTIDVFYAYSDDKCPTYQCDFHGSPGTLNNDDSMKKKGYVCVRRLEFPVSKGIRRVKFENIEVNIPSNAEEWLKYRYGDDYMIPNPNFQDKGDNPHIHEWEDVKAVMINY